VLILQKITTLADGTVLSISASVQCEELAPLRPDSFVRGILAGEFLLLEPLEDGKRTKVSRLSKVDPGGYAMSFFLFFF
jgi:hypothetical protein